MGRFLTPSKIVILGLARIYAEGSVPLPGTSLILHVVLSRILPDSEESAELLEIDAKDSILDIERGLAGQASVVPGRTVWDLLVRKIWEIDCAHALDGFLTDLPQLLGKTRDQLLKERDEGLPPTPSGKIVRTSPLGLFIRRCCLEYNRLQFQDSVAVWTDFVSYRMPTKGAYSRKNPRSALNAFDVNLSDMGIEASHPLAGIMFRSIADSSRNQESAYSNTDAERLMEFQVSAMQNTGGRLPPSMQSQLKQMSNEGVHFPKLAHYLRFLDSWRAGDFASAFDNLHRYFDYTMQSRDNTYYQYALLNLAILQADFGCHEEAIAAMQEAIATARENRDTSCLNYCMSWLYHFGRTFPAQMQAVRETGILGNEIEGLQFLKSRAKDAEMWTLLSTTLLSEAKLDLQQGQSIAHVFENIVKSNHINVVKSITNTGPTLLMKSTTFSRIGQTHMACSCIDRFLICYSKNAPIEDILKGMLKQAALMAQTGRFNEAEQILANVPPHVLKVLKYKNSHTTAIQQIRARRLLHRSSLIDAGVLIRQLLSQSPYPDTENTFHIALLEIDYLTRLKDFPRALEKITKLAERLPVENNDVVMRVKLMILKAQLFARSDKPLQGFTLTMRAMDMSYRARALPQLWDATLVLANILNETYEYTASRDMLTAILPAVLETLDCDLAGRLYLLLADSYMGLAGMQAEDDAKGIAKRKRLVGDAMEALEKAGEQFKFAEELESQLEVLAKMGRICAWRGDVGLAAEMGERYVRLKKSYEEDNI